MTTYSKTLMMGVAAIALMAGSAWAQDQTRVGVVSAVNPAAVGTPPGADTRPIVIGSDVTFREKVVTTADGQAQLMFLDQSTMMIGPNSQVVIDEFVFDPNTSSGQFAATLTQGSFRYIGGKLSKQGNATLRTPVATIGIRGSDVIVNHDAGTNASGIQNIHGNGTVESNGKTRKLPTGFSTAVNGPGQGPTYPEALTAAAINAAKAAFEGQPGKTAGASVVPQNEHVENSGLSGTVEARQLAAIEPAAGPGASLNRLQPPVIPIVRNKPGDDGAPPPSPPPPASSPPPNNGGGNGGGVIIENPPPPAITSVVVNDLPGDVQIRLVSPEGEGPGSVIARFRFHTAGVVNNDSAGALPGPLEGAVTLNGYVSGVKTSINGGFINDATVDFGDFPGTPPGTQSQVFNDNSFLAVSRLNDTTIETNTGVQPVNASVNGTASASNMVLVTIDQASIQLPLIVPNLGNVPICTCEFMSWGLWGGVIQGPTPQNRLDVILGTFVAGTLPNINIEPTGSATFAGHIVGVGNSGNIVAGSFQNDYSFTQRSGTVTVSNFDGNNMTGTVNARTGDWRSYTGGLAPTSAGPATAGTVNGSFFTGGPSTPPGNQPAGTGGNIALSGPNNYNATGVFVAGRVTPTN